MDDNVPGERPAPTICSTAVDPNEIIEIKCPHCGQRKFCRRDSADIRSVALCVPCFRIELGDTFE